MGEHQADGAFGIDSAADNQHHPYDDWGPTHGVAGPHDLLGATDFGDRLSPPPEIITEPLHIEPALDAAIARSGFDPRVDYVGQGWLSDLQGITAEFLVADALNQRDDGLTYHLYSDPTHPDVDIAGIKPSGEIAQLIQVKATGDGSYAASGLHPGVELVTTRDGYTTGAVPMDITAAALRAQIKELLASAPSTPS